MEEVLTVKYLRQLGIVLTICLLGEMISKLLNISIPGNVLGMILLIIILFSRIIKVEMIEEISDFLLKHLAFFFIPAGVGLISNLELLKEQWLPILIICLISTLMVIIVTGLTIQFVKRRLKL